MYSTYRYISTEGEKEAGNVPVSEKQVLQWGTVSSDSSGAVQSDRCSEVS